MRTNEERMRLISKRTHQIRRRKQHLREGICMAVCLLLIVGCSIWMPLLMQGAANGSMLPLTGVASLLAKDSELGYILVGLLAFLLGICVAMLLYRQRRRNEHGKEEEEEDEF